MKIIDKLSALSPEKPFYTFEFFPPKTVQGSENLLARISRLCRLHPLAVSITWGAGGSTKERSLELAGLSQSRFGVDTLLHLTCTNMEKGMVDKALEEARARGIENILALRGDPPRGSDHWIPTDPRFTHALDLVSYIQSLDKYSGIFCIGVAGYPDGYPDSTLSEDEELEYLKSKVDAGADFIVTQLFYDVEAFLSWTEKVRLKGIRVPILPGIMPIQNYSSFIRLAKLCGSRVPSEIWHALEPIKTDDQKVKDFGISLATHMIQSIVKNSAIRGFHFCTLNLEKSVQNVLENLQWVGKHSQTVNRVITDAANGELSELTDANLRITPLVAAATAATSLADKPAPVACPREAGKGELNNAATWDEFPNGRFGDVKSPAYGGGIDLWTPRMAKTGNGSSGWAHPKSTNDITSLFLSYLHSHQEAKPSPVTPFSEAPMASESVTIVKELINLTERGWWTVGSQPAIDAAPSEDETVGWGPRGGWVFQKAFVEFFAEEDVVIQIEELVKKDGRGMVSFFAGDNNDNFRTNMGTEGRNAVTWGVFPGHEIEQPTIIEKESFLAWKEETFNIWLQWALSCPPGSAGRIYLEEVRSKRWLVSVVHHDFKDSEALWTFLSKI